MLWWHVWFSLGTYLFIFCRARRWSLIGAMAKAYGQLLLDLPGLLQSRRYYQHQRVVSDRKLAELGLQLNLLASLRLAMYFLSRRQDLLTTPKR